MSRAINERQLTIAITKVKLATALVLILLAALLSGCEGNLAPPQEWGVDQCRRAELFQACMKALPAGPVAPKYNDWDEVVDSCASAARDQAVRADFRAIKPECRQ